MRPRPPWARSQIFLTGEQSGVLLGGFVGRLEVSRVPLGIVRARLRGFAGAAGECVRFMAKRCALWKNFRILRCRIRAVNKRACLAVPTRACIRARELLKSIVGNAIGLGHIFVSAWPVFWCRRMALHHRLCCAKHHIHCRQHNH